MLVSLSNCSVKGELSFLSAAGSLVGYAAPWDNTFPVILLFWKQQKRFTK